MKKWLLGVLLCLALLSSFLVPGVASAHTTKATHATHAATASCSYDTCDGQYWDQKGCWNGGSDPNVHVIASNVFTPAGFSKKVGVELLRSSTCHSVWTYSWVLNGSSINQGDEITYEYTDQCDVQPTQYTNGPYTRSTMWSQMVGELGLFGQQRYGVGYWFSPDSPYVYAAPAGAYCTLF